MLCETLRNTGIAGSPAEYFNPYPFILKHRAQYLGVKKDTEYLRKVIEHSTTSNGVFGTKVQAWQFPFFVSKLEADMCQRISDPAQALAKRFPNLQYIWLTRKNEILQAISLYRANYSRVWWDFKELPPMYKQETSYPDPAFSFEHIASFLDEIHRGKIFWQGYFMKHNIVPLHITYEDLAEAYEKTVHRTLEFLGLAFEGAMPLPATIRQADARSYEWERLFREELKKKPRLEERFLWRDA